MVKQQDVFYVPSSHWDREWYLPFQDYRHKLVRLMDQVLADLASGVMEGPFTGDGQAILIEDYLEIRPEKEAELRAHVAEGRIVFGPWYVLPDEFLVSGESLLRNLRFGKSIVRSFGGEPSTAGFVCDLFGHNSQMPQILMGFGSVGGLVWRGVDIRKGGRFLWEGADGSCLPTYRFGKSGYCDYTYKVRRSTDERIAFDPEEAAEALAAFIEEERERMGPDSPALVFDGGDHLLLDPRHYAVLQDHAKKTQDYCLRHGTLDAFLEGMAASFTGDEPRVRGELREPTRWPTTEDQSFLIPGCLASRVWAKQENAALESLLCDWVEPFAAFAHLALGIEHPSGFLQVAWRWLLQNHPHDSICGCSVDQVHEDMKYRFSQCRQLGERLLDESLRTLAAAAPGSLAPHERRLAVFNSLPEPRTGVFEFEVEIPVEWPEFTEFFGYEPKPAFRLFRGEEPIPYQRLGTRRSVTRKRLRDLHYPKPYKVHVVRVAAELALPALGAAQLRVEGIETKGNGADHLGNRHVPVTRHPAAPGLRTGRCTMENAFLRVAIQPDGGLTLVDKASGQRYTDLNLFEDDADIGDGWYHGPTVNRRDVVSGSAQIELLCDTPLLTTFVVRQTLLLPRAYDTRTDARSTERAPLLCESFITLRADAEGLDVETHIENSIHDHRLRVLFPTGADATTYLADAPFDVVERPIALRADNHTYREMEVETKPQQSWTAVFDQSRGLALVCSGGLLETAVPDRPERPIALTLFRATGRTKMTDGEPEGQMEGMPLTFRYRILPLVGQPDRSELFRHARILADGIRTVCLSQSDLDFERGKYDGPEQATGELLRLEGAAVPTSIRQVDGATEIRVFNPHEVEVTASLLPGEHLPAEGACLVDFESQPMSETLSIAEDGITAQVGPKKIRTIRLSR